MLASPLTYAVYIVNVQVSRTSDRFFTIFIFVVCPVNIVCSFTTVAGWYADCPAACGLTYARS